MTIPMGRHEDQVSHALAVADGAWGAPGSNYEMRVLAKEVRAIRSEIESLRRVVEAVVSYEKKFPGEAFRKSSEGHAVVKALAALPSKPAPEKP